MERKAKHKEQGMESKNEEQGMKSKNEEQGTETGGRQKRQLESNIVWTVAIEIGSK